MNPQGGGFDRTTSSRRRSRSRERESDRDRRAYPVWGADRGGRGGEGGGSGGHYRSGQDGRAWEEHQRYSREGGTEQYQSYRRDDVDDLGRELVHNRNHHTHQTHIATRPGETLNTVDDKSIPHQVNNNATTSSSSVKDAYEVEVLGDEDEEEKKEEETKEKEVELDDEAIAAALGFNSFGSTKGVAVADNQVGPARGAAAKGVPKKVYRQYMHRVTGFAHALDAQLPSKRKS